jgi:phosphatidate phosphatase APP1
MPLVAFPFIVNTTLSHHGPVFTILITSGMASCRVASRQIIHNQNDATTGNKAHLCVDGALA